MLRQPGLQQQPEIHQEGFGFMKTLPSPVVPPANTREFRSLHPEKAGEFSVLVIEPRVAKAWTNGGVPRNPVGAFNH